MTVNSLTSMLDDVEPLSLDELVSVASLQSRVDRKYVLEPERLARVIEAVGDRARVLEIDGRRAFGYETIYFDTPELDSYLSSARRRPYRFKVRTRTYLDSGLCGVEVKLCDQRGRTVKHRLEHDIAYRDRITPQAAAFIDRFERLAPLRSSLRPTLATTYQRSTMLIGVSRATLDVGVACTAAGEGAMVGAAGLDGAVIVETKCPGGACALDRMLWSMHVRPTTISKYGTGLAALRPDLPSNKWHRTLARHVRVQANPLTEMERLS